MQCLSETSAEPPGEAEAPLATRLVDGYPLGTRVKVSVLGRGGNSLGGEILRTPPEIRRIHPFGNIRDITRP